MDGQPETDPREGSATRFPLSPRTGLPADFYDGFPPPKAKMTNEEDIVRLRKFVNAGR